MGRRKARPHKTKVYKAPKGYRLESAGQPRHTRRVHVVYRKKCPYK